MYLNQSRRVHQITYNSHFSKKRLCPRKKFLMVKIFRIDIFILKYGLDHSKSISTKKFFEKFSIFWSLFAILGPKNRSFEFFGIEILIFFGGGGKEILNFFFTHFKSIVLRSFCAIARISTPIELCRLTRFIEFLTKNGQK